MNPIRKLIGEAEDFSEYEDLLKLDAEQERSTREWLSADELVKISQYKVLTPEQKKYLAQYPEKAVNYAFGMKSRFPEAEPNIAKHAKAAYTYAVLVLKQRWIDAIANKKLAAIAEETIRDSAYYEEYMQNTERTSKTSFPALSRATKIKSLEHQVAREFNNIDAIKGYESAEVPANEVLNHAKANLETVKHHFWDENWPRSESVSMAYAYAKSCLTELGIGYRDLTQSRRLNSTQKLDLELLLVNLSNLVFLLKSLKEKHQLGELESEL